MATIGVTHSRLLNCRIMETHSELAVPMIMLWAGPVDSRQAVRSWQPVDEENSDG